MELQPHVHSRMSAKPRQQAPSVMVAEDHSGEPIKPRTAFREAVEKSARSIASLRYANSLDRLSVAFGPVRHKRVAWQGLIRHLSRFRHSGHRQVARIKQADLHKNGSLIPVDMLMRELAVTELHDCDKRHLDLAAGGRHAR